MSRGNAERVNPFLFNKLPQGTPQPNVLASEVDENPVEEGSLTDSYMEISRQVDMDAVAAIEPSFSGDAVARSMEIVADAESQRPSSLSNEKTTFPYDLDGIVSKDGDMTHFVTENLEYKIKLSSPVARKDFGGVYLKHNSILSSSGFSGVPSFFTPQQQNQQPQIDSNVLNDIEIEAQYLAASVDNLTENLCNLLHSVSSITADNVEIHKNAVNKLTDSMDANIKSMYTIMAKTEEISKSMKPTEHLAVRIREIKRLVDMLESNL